MFLSIGNRILFSFAAAILLMLGLGIYAVSAIGDLRETSSTIVGRDIAALRTLGQIESGELRMRSLRDSAMQEFLLRSMSRTTADSGHWLPDWRTEMDAAETAVQEVIKSATTYANSAVTQARAQSWRSIAETVGDLVPTLRQKRDLGERLFSSIHAGDLDAAQATMGDMLTLQHTLAAQIARSRGEVDKSIAVGQDRIAQIYETSRQSMIVAISIAAILAILITYFLRSPIARPLATFMQFVEKVGRGDLSGAQAATGKDELGQLGATLNSMVEGLRDLARQNREATENLNASAAEIRASTQEQAASVEEQLAAIQETAATVDEITHSGVQVGKRAQEVILSAQATVQTSAAGLRAVSETAHAMDLIREQAETVAENIVALSEKTQAISDIISTVNDISERSHLLALNAAIEAAAAGESGRSFAVVASEMKVLADQAKEATVQVRSILGDIQRGISSSVMLTEEAVKRAVAGKERTDTSQRTIDEMGVRVQESVQTFQQIVASTNQQQLGIEQVMGALQNIRQASQQTAAGTRQLDSAAGTLSQLAQQLMVLADRYRL